MIDKQPSMFSDRRKRNDRRKQDLPMPAGLDRRINSRRNGHFNAKPWWLSIDYSEELVTEAKNPEQHDSIDDTQHPTKPSSSH